MAQQLEGTLTVLAYEDSFPEELISAFLAAHPALRFRHLPYDTDGEAIAMLESGVEPDVVAGCIEENLALLTGSGHLRPIDVGRVGRWGEILPWFTSLPGVVQGGRVWMVPIDSAPTGLTFDTTQRPTPASFADLFDASRAGRIALDAKPAVALHIGALVLGIPDPPAMGGAELERVSDFFIGLKREGRFPILWETYDDLARLFGERSIVASSGFPGDTRYLQAAGLPVDFVVASEGSMLFACGFGIGTRCRNEVAAYAFLDYMLGPEPQSYLARQKHFNVSNATVRAQVAPELGGVKHLAAGFLSDAEAPAPPVHLAAWNHTWQHVLTASG